MSGSGGGSSPSAGNQVTQSVELKTEAQKKAIEAMLKEYAPTVGAFQPYEGDRLAPFSDLQRTALSGADNFAKMFSTPQATVDPAQKFQQYQSLFKNPTGPLLKETETATRDMLAGKGGAAPLTGGDVDDYYNKSFYDPAQKRMKEDINPAIDEAFAGPGFFGAARSQERVGAAQDTSDWLGEQRGALDWNMLMRNQDLDEARVGRQLSAIPMGMQQNQQPFLNEMTKAQNTMDFMGVANRDTLNNMQVAATQVQGLGELFGLGSAQQTQEQQALTMELVKFMETYQLTDPESLKVLMSLIGEGIKQDSSTETEPNAWKSEQWGQWGANVGAGMLGGLFS